MGRLGAQGARWARDQGATAPWALGPGNRTTAPGALGPGNNSPLGPGPWEPLGPGPLGPRAQGTTAPWALGPGNNSPLGPPDPWGARLLPAVRGQRGGATCTVPKCTVLVAAELTTFVVGPLACARKPRLRPLSIAHGRNEIRLMTWFPMSAKLGRARSSQEATDSAGQVDHVTR